MEWLFLFFIHHCCVVTRAESTLLGCLVDRILVALSYGNDQPVTDTAQLYFVAVRVPRKLG